MGEYLWLTLRVMVVLVNGISGKLLTMPNAWIIDVLTDLRVFAEQNGLARLADQLDDTVLVAASELAADGNAVNDGPLEHASKPRGAYSALAAGDNA